MGTIIQIKRILLEGSGLDKSNKLLDELDQFLKDYNIPKTELIIFGSFILGIKDIRSPNDLDIGITEKYFDQIKLKNKNIKDQSHLHINIGNLSFIKKENLPRYKNQNLFDIKHQNYNGYKTITFEQWKEMQRRDPRKKDKDVL